MKSKNSKIGFARGSKPRSHKVGFLLRFLLTSSPLPLPSDTNDLPSATYAAGIAANLVITHSGVDYGDWYLPSKFELNLMWLNLANSGLGGFASSGYWSSSQYNSANAWVQLFDDGYQYGDASKSLPLRVRAVRVFKQTPA
jgi:hypothetical protein